MAENIPTFAENCRSILESTGLFEVYNFDDEGSSASDVHSQYLGQLAKSDIAVFLIWNKHGVTDAVYSEHRKAAECDLKRRLLKKYGYRITDYALTFNL